MNLYEKCIEKPFSFLVINPFLTSDNTLLFRNNLVERIQKQLIIRLDMKKCNIMLVQKQQKCQHYPLENLINMSI